MTKTAASQATHILRVLATSDMHAHVLDYNYTHPEREGAYGLARIASLVQEARAEQPGSVLLDNGDFLQGTPLGDMAASQGGANPVIAAMNALAYDAMGLGNHEFNFGLARLDEVLRQAVCPVICANVLTRRGTTALEDATRWPATTIMDRDLTDLVTGATDRLKVGVLSVVPPQVTTWDKAHLRNRVETRDMVDAARAHAKSLRAQGADIILALAHTGIERETALPCAENAARAIARLSDVDAVIAGHSHRMFPDPESAAARHDPIDGVDHVNGTLHGKPAVMPGFRGAYLGVLDLGLAKTATGWRVRTHRAILRPVTPSTPADAGITALVTPSHAAVLQKLSRRLCDTPRPIHSYLSRVRCDEAVRIVLQAQVEAARASLAGTGAARLPILSASAPFRTGGRAGPTAFTDILKGPLTLRSVADLYPFPNTLCVLRLNGAEVCDWLECAASCFCQVPEGVRDANLINPDFPGHAFDTILGLRYEIDLRAPAMFGPDGARFDSPGRIRKATFAGKPLDPKTEFTLVTSSYRAFGGGPYPTLPDDRLIHQGTGTVPDLLADFLADGGIGRVPDKPCWRFTALPGSTAIFETGPEIARHGRDLAALGAKMLEATPEGFVRLRLSLAETPCESAL